MREREREREREKGGAHPHRHSFTLHESVAERETDEGVLSGVDVTNWWVAGSPHKQADSAAMPDGQSAIEWRASQPAPSGEGDACRRSYHIHWVRPPFRWGSVPGGGRRASVHAQCKWRRGRSARRMVDGNRERPSGRYERSG